MAEISDGTILLPISGIGGPHQGVYLCRSTDAGESWSEPELVGKGIADFDWSDSNPERSSAGRGVDRWTGVM